MRLGLVSNTEKNNLKMIVASALKSYIKWREKKLKFLSKNKFWISKTISNVSCSTRDTHPTAGLMFNAFATGSLKHLTRNSKKWQ